MQILQNKTKYCPVINTHRLRGNKGMAQIIQNKKEDVISSANAICCKARTLQKQEIQEDNETNITVKEKSTKVYLRSQELKERYQDVLELDAGHIKDLGGAFDQLDQKISVEFGAKE